MFIITELEDLVKIQPWKFQRDTNDIIKSTLNRKFSNKVLHNVGLCVSLFDIIKVNEFFLLAGDGATQTKIRFNLIVFRPFIDEILVGKVRGSSRSEGIRVSLGFFDNVLILPQSMPHPSRFDDDEQLWVWQYDNEDGANDMIIDIGQDIRFKVIEEKFIDISPKVSQSGSEAQQSSNSPYTIYGSISESGLGLVSWWNG